VKDLIIIGASGHGKSCLDAAISSGDFNFLGWLDNSKEIGETVFGYKVLGKTSDLFRSLENYPDAHYFLAISNNWSRYLVYTEFKELVDIKWTSIIHSNAYISSTAKIGVGVLMLSGVNLGPGCIVDDFCILNTSSSLDHDSRMASFSSLLPGVITAGNVSIGLRTCICIGSSISHSVEVGDDVCVGGGSLVLKNIPSNIFGYGVPFKSVRSRGKDEKHF